MIYNCNHFCFSYVMRYLLLKINIQLENNTSHSRYNFPTGYVENPVGFSQNHTYFLLIG